MKRFLCFYILIILNKMIFEQNFQIFKGKI